MGVLLKKPPPPSLDFIRPFLALASLKAFRLWRCTFGLTTRFLHTLMLPIFKHPLSKKIERGLLYEEKVVLLHADYYQVASKGGRPRVNSCVCNLAKA